MRRLHTVTLGALPFAVLCLCIIAALTSRHRILRSGFSTSHGRYTFSIDHARILVRVPPRSMKQDGEAWELLRQLRNEDIQWKADWFHFDASDPKSRMLFTTLMPRFKRYSVARQVHDLDSVSDTPFLRALDNSQGFVAAHVFLTDRRHTALNYSVLNLPPGVSSYRVQFQGIQFRLTAEPRPPLAPFGWVEVPNSDLVAIPGQLPSIREMWHDSLDRTFLSINIWWIAGGIMLLISLQCVSAVRRISRLRSGRCVQCGYDLRASNERCPECGMLIPIKRKSVPASN